MPAASNPTAAPASHLRTLVWDTPTRVFHWLLALCFLVAYVTADSDAFERVHVTAGYTMAGLVGFRILWGLLGTRHARFADFVRGPARALRYLRSLWGPHPEHHAGHNPAGGLAVLGLLLLSALTAVTGWATRAGLAGHWLEETHEALANGLLALVAVHIVAVILSSLLHRENLVAAMLHGRKAVPPVEGIRKPRRAVAVLLLAAVLGFWWVQWTSPIDSPAAHRAHSREADD